MGTTTGIPKELLEQYQQLAQQQMQISLARSPYQGAGLMGAFGGFSTGATGTQGWMAQQDVSSFQQAYQQVLQLQPMGKSDYNNRIRFNRINEIVEIDKYSTITTDGNRLEPLDELRIKVAECLNN